MGIVPSQLSKAGCDREDHEIKSKDDLAKVKFEKDFDSALGVIQKTMDEEFKKLGANNMTKEYKTIREIAGPLIFVEKTEPVGTMNWSITLPDRNYKERSGP